MPRECHAEVSSSSVRTAVIPRQGEMISQASPISRMVGRANMGTTGRPSPMTHRGRDQAMVLIPFAAAAAVTSA